MNADHTPSVSVIIVTYNRSHFIEPCTRGVKAGGVADVQIIIADDGSTDDTAEVTARVCPDAIFHTQKNSGPAAARNNAFAKATGKYICFLDSDDEWLPDAAGEAVQFLDANPDVDVLFADANMGNAKQGYTSWIATAGQDAFFQLPHEERQPGFRVLDAGPFFRRMCERNAVFLGAMLVRRSALEKVGLFDMGMCGAADWNLWLRMAAQVKFAYFHKPFAVYTRHLDAAANMSNDHDGMSREFCLALRKLKSQVKLTPEHQVWVEERLRHHLFAYAYRMYIRGNYPEARKRFADLLKTSGLERRGMSYWATCALPGKLPGMVRHLKQTLTGSRDDAPPPPTDGQAKAVLTGAGS